MKYVNDIVLVGIEKTFYLLDKINDVLGTTSKSRNLRLHPTGDLWMIPVTQISSILRMLQDEGLLKWFRDPTSQVYKMTVMPFSEDWGYYTFEITEELPKYYEELQSQEEYKKYQLKTAEALGRKHQLERDSSGNYFYEGKKIDVPKTAEYYKVFDSIFTNLDQNNFISYEDIERVLVTSRNLAHLEEKDSIKRIANALNKSQGFFRYAKVNEKSLTDTASNGKKFINKVSGKGVSLNNPVI